MAKKEWYSFRALSRVDYGEKVDPDALEGRDVLKKGALLRIADALERLAAGKTELETQKELDVTKAKLATALREFENSMYVRGNLWRRISAYKGIITKLKKAR